jgi:hypothetical protein
MGRPDSVFTLAVTLDAGFNAQAAERETRQMAKEQQQQLTSLRRPIEERSDLIQRVKAVQAAEREPLAGRVAGWW